MIFYWIILHNKIVINFKQIFFANAIYIYFRDLWISQYAIVCYAYEVSERTHLLKGVLRVSLRDRCRKRSFSKLRQEPDNRRSHASPR